MPIPRPKVRWDLVPALAPNVAITDSNTGQLSAECSIAINPKAPNNIICAVRQVPAANAFTASIVTIYCSSDFGKTWQASASLGLVGTDLASNKIVFGANANASVGWDADGIAYLLTLAVTTDFTNLVGIAFYRSTTCGASWENPLLLSTKPTDDKPNLLIDTGSESNFPGRVYAIWMRVGDDGNQVALASSDNKGNTWATSDNSATWKIFTANPWPTVSISPDDGVLYVAQSRADGFQVMKSIDGGASFAPSSPEPIGNLAIMRHDSDTVMVGQANESASRIGNGTFRADAFVSVVAGRNGLLLCAYLEPNQVGSDPANGIAYLRSTDYGVTWLPRTHAPQRRNLALSHGEIVQGAVLFSPQLAITPRGVIVCNYYCYVPTGVDEKARVGESLGQSIFATVGVIGVCASLSFDNGESFSDAYKISDSVWSTDVANTDMIEIAEVIIPYDFDLHLKFIGDYFGLAVGGALTDVDDECFISAWTDARSPGDGSKGREQIYCSMVRPIPK